MIKDRPSNSRCVAIDLDGVLIDGMPFHIQAWQAAFKPFGIRLNDEELYLLEGIKTPKVVESIIFSKRLSISPAEFNEIVERKKEVYSRIFKVVPLPGSEPLIKFLNQCGYSLALVTGTSKSSADKTLQALDIGHFFSHIISSESVEKGKPFPDPYLKALSLFKVKPMDCIVIENSPPGIQSAISAGLNCIAVATYLPLKYLSLANIIVENVGKAKNWFHEEFEKSNGTGTWIF